MEAALSPDPDLDTVVSVHEEDLPVSQSCYTMSSSLSSFIVASTMACLVPATLTVVGDCSLVMLLPSEKCSQVNSRHF